VIKIVVLNDQSEPLRGTSRAGLVIAARMRSRILAPRKGHEVEILSADHQNKPDVGSAIARSVRRRQGGRHLRRANSGVALAVNQITRDKARP